jgi:hypothetical protein
MDSADLPVLQISSEPGADLESLTAQIREWISAQKWIASH